MKPMRMIVLASSLVLASCGFDPGERVDEPEVGTSEAWGALAIDSSDFVVAGARWWTATSAPWLRGLFVADGPVTIEVSVTGAAPVPARLDGTSWAAQLPAGSIGDAGTEVTVVMTNADGNRLSVRQTLVLDTAAPSIALLPSHVRDERHDVIDFSTGEPVHTHAGPPIALGDTECTVIYKHAYLTGASLPPFGSQTTRNPIRYALWIDDTQLDASFTAFRVRTPANEVLRDWTELVPYASRYTIWLLADGGHGVPELATRSGTYLVDVRARDWSGLASTVTWCFDLRLLAAPLQIDAVEPARKPSADMPTLWSMSMTAKSPMSLLASDALGPAVVSQHVVQYTAEAIALKYHVIPAAMRFTRTYVDDYVAVAKTPLANTTCEQMRCDLPPLADPPDSTTRGPLTEHEWRMMLIDEDTGNIVPALPEGVPVIPPRAAGEPPRGYLLVAHLGEVDDLRPARHVAPQEHSLAGFSYTGRAPFDEQTRCTATEESCGAGGCVTLCTEATTYQRMIALDHAALELDGLSFELTTSPSPSAGAEPSWAPQRSFTIGALTWDSGDAHLPGDP